MRGKRYLVITADDFGIGPETTRGILDLARNGMVTASVLLVNSPFAKHAIWQWRQAGGRLELGWHLCLTLDRPILPPQKVPTLVDKQGKFFPLGPFLRKLFLGRIKPAEIQVEIQAQYDRFMELTGSPPSIVNGHHHIHVLPVIGKILRDLLSRQSCLPYLRRVAEPWPLLTKIPETRVKRLFLSVLGTKSGRRQKAIGFSGNEALAGLSDPKSAGACNYFTRWLRHSPGRIVELMCHPGYPDKSLLGRDARTEADLNYRYLELQRLQDPAFQSVCLEAGFTLIAPGELLGFNREREKYAA